MQLIRTLVAPGTLERPRQQRMRERLPRDPLGIQPVGLPPLPRPIRPRSPFAHTSRTSCPRPIRKIAVCRPQPEAPSIPHRCTGPNCPPHASSARCPSPETRKGRRRHFPADPRPSRSPSAYADRSRPHCHPKQPSTRPSRPPSATPPVVGCGDPVDNVPVGIGAPQIDAPIGSDRLEDTDRGRHFVTKDTERVQTPFGSSPVRSSTLTRTVARAGGPDFNTGNPCVLQPARSRRLPWRRSQVRLHAARRLG